MIVTTQEELDAAIAAGDADITISTTTQTWFSVMGSISVVARGSAIVETWDTATVEAWDTVHVKAWDFSTVEAWDSVNVVARGAATVEAWDSATVIALGSATVMARGSVSVLARESATVDVWDSVTITARNSANVTAYGSANVEAWGEARVTAWDFASVVARGSVTVTAWDSTRVRASRYVAVRLHSAHATVTGGTVIDLTAPNLSHVTDWAEYQDAEVVDGEVIVFKAVDADLRSERGFTYPIGKTVTCPDWNARPVCGGGLHFSPHPAQARDYYQEATRFLRCAVPVGEAVVIDGKVTSVTPKLKARTARVLCEVDARGNEVTG